MRLFAKQLHANLLLVKLFEFVVTIVIDGQLKAAKQISSIGNISLMNIS